MRRALAVLLLALGGCRRAALPEPDAAASTRSGALPFAAVEQALRQQGSPPGADPDELVAAYRKLAEELAVRRALLPSSPQEFEKALAELGPERDKLRRQAAVDLYVQQRLRLDLSVGEQDVRAWYGAHAELFHRPGQRAVWHIFRRHANPARPRETLALVESLRKRIEAGANFADVARESSDSETRVLGGRLGVVSPGRLPKPVEKVVFALGEGELSAPISTRDGVFLFRATDVVPEKRFPLEDVRLSILRALREARLREALAAAVRDQPLPAGALVLDAATLRRTLALGDDEPVLDLGGLRVTVKELRDAYLERRRGAPPPLEPDREAERFYETLAHSQRLYLRAEAEGFVAQNQATLQAVEPRLGSERLFARAVERRMWELVDADPAALERFHRDNAFLYQTSLRLRLRALGAPLGERPAERLARLEKLREDLVAGRTTLETVARSLGGHVRDAGWVADAELAHFEPKVRYYVLDMNATGYSIAFQLNRQLLLIQVQEREEPRLRPLAEVEDAVRRDFFERSQQDLYRRVVEDVLRREEFRFNETAVRGRLAMPAGGAS